MLPHKNNIQHKINTNYKSQRNFFVNFFNDHYKPWHESNLKIKSFSKKEIQKRVSLLANYYKRVEEANDKNRPSSKSKNWITPQSKFRPTVLEEFCYYILKDVPEISQVQLEFRNKKINVGFDINPNGEIVLKNKDVDCCLVKAEQCEIGQKKFELLIPVIAIECKTYLDGTMWNESQYSASLLKRVNSRVRVYILTEDNYVDISKITQESPIDDVFVIKTKDSRKLDDDTILEFIRQIQKDLQSVTKSKPIKIPGRLIHF